MSRVSTPSLPYNATGSSDAGALIFDGPDFAAILRDVVASEGTSYCRADLVGLPSRSLVATAKHQAGDTLGLARVKI